MRQLILVRYGEIYLKGLNRPYFMRALVSRVKQAVRPFGGRVWLHDARIFISDMNDMDGCMQAVSKVCIRCVRRSKWKRTILMRSAIRRCG